MKDDLGNRMKQNYEVRTRTYLPRRTNTIIRIDGKAFHTFTKRYQKPFDDNLISLMNKTAEFLCQNIQGAVMGYVQSDEISILLNDYTKLTTDAWFDGNVQKMTSISASMATAIFNVLQLQDNFSSEKNSLATFDSRVFTIPEIDEVINYFIWRQQDAVRNSISMVAQSLYSHNELNGKSSKDMQEMIFQKGQNWNDLDAGKKRGRMIIKEPLKREISESVGKSLITKNDNRVCWDNSMGYYINTSGWVIRDSVDFNKNKELIHQYLMIKNNVNLF